jgi:hypothetical protein
MDGSVCAAGLGRFRTEKERGTVITEGRGCAASGRRQTDAAFARGGYRLAGVPEPWIGGFELVEIADPDGKRILLSNNNGNRVYQGALQRLLRGLPYPSNNPLHDS